MKERLLQKRNEKGFTLMEMLIVVAIIAILVAIAIPVFNAQLEKARESTDSANVRSAKAVAVASYLTDGTTTTRFFDAATGTLKAAKTGIATYGQGTATGSVADVNTSKIIQVEVTSEGVVTCSWVTLT